MSLNTFESDYVTRRRNLLLLIKLVSRTNLGLDYKKHITELLAETIGFARAEGRRLLADRSLGRALLPKKESARIGCFYHLLFVLRLRGELLNEEVRLCRNIGFKLGLNPALINSFIRITKLHPGQSLPVQKLLQAVKTYLN